LSGVTVASLADLGYSVNMAAADSFTPSSSGRSAALRAARGGSSSSIVAAFNDDAGDVSAAANGPTLGTSTEIVAPNSASASAYAKAASAGGTAKFSQAGMFWTKPQLVDALFDHLAGSDRDDADALVSLEADLNDGDEAGVHFLALG